MKTTLLITLSLAYLLVASSQGKPDPATYELEVLGDPAGAEGYRFVRKDVTEDASKEETPQPEDAFLKQEYRFVRKDVAEEAIKGETPQPEGAFVKQEKRDADKGQSSVNDPANRGQTEIGSADNDGYWGTYAPAQRCPDNFFVYGYRMKSEGKRGNGDDTGLNAVELSCLGPVATTAPVPITSKTGPWGTYDSFKYCPGDHNPVVGFRMLIEPKQGGGDDTAANAMDLYCKNGEHIVAPHKTRWGTYGSILKCPNGKAVIGLRTRVEPKLGSGDDSALNGVRLICYQYSYSTGTTVSY